MSKDIVQRLRDCRQMILHHDGDRDWDNGSALNVEDSLDVAVELNEAADHIEQLEAEVGNLKEQSNDWMGIAESETTRAEAAEAQASRMMDALDRCHLASQILLNMDPERHQLMSSMQIVFEVSRKALEQ